MRILRLLSVLLAFVAGPAFAATKVWISTNSFAGLWSDGTNWQGGVAPVSGDRVVFRCCRTFSTNDIPNLALDGIDFENFNLIEGLGVDLTGAVPITVSGTRFGGFTSLVPFRFTASNVTIEIATTITVVEFGRALTFSGGTGTINATGTTLHIEAINDENPISLVIRARQTNIFANSTFRGTLSYSGFGSWLRTPPLGLGAASAGTLVEGDASLFVRASPSDVVAEPLDLRMSGPNAQFGFSGGPMLFAGPIAITGPQLFAVGTEVNFAGPISGDGRIVVIPSPNPMTLSNGRNSFTGGLQVQAATVHLGNSGVVPGTGELVIESGGVVDFATYAQQANAVACAGTMVMGVGATLRAGTTVDIRGCTLQIAYPSNFVGPNADIRLVDNAGTSPVLGTFAGLPERSPVMTGGTTRYISYTGGDGNDVVLRTTPDALPTAGPNIQDMWWSPVENGWGMSIVQHGNGLFIAVYAYDAQGKATWYVIPAGTWNGTFTRFAGDVYAPRGSPFFQYNSAAFVPGFAIGNLAIVLDNNVNPSTAVVDYTIDGVTGHKVLSRQPFGRGTTSAVGSYGNMWWGGGGQAGWGVSLLQQGDTLFNVWFTYDAAGSRTWFVMPGGTWTSADTYEGRLYRTLGSPWLAGGYDPSMLQVFDAGPYRLRFRGDTATLDYSIDGRVGSMPLEKQPF